MKEKAFKACLKVIETSGWKNFSFFKASRSSGIPLYVFHTQFSSPLDIMTYLFRTIDAEVLKNLDPSLESLSPKDALFDILMARLDAAQPYKSVLRVLWQEWILSPEDAPHLAIQGFSSMAWMLEAAGLNSRGLTGFLRIQGLTALYLLTVRKWLEDESSDLGKTMAFLDQGLTHLEKLTGFLNFCLRETP